MKRFTGVLLALLLVLSLPVTRVQAAELSGSAKSAVLMEASTGKILYESNAHEALPPASVTKIMTMLLIMEAIDAGKLTLDDTVTASEAAAAKGGSQIYLKVGEQLSVRDMLKSIAVSSANDCACAMAEHLAGSEDAFVEQMNARAKELGMNDTHFVNCTGLDDAPEAAEHVTSAYDIALMSRELLVNHPDIKQFTTIWMDTVRGGTFGLSNTNKLIRFYSGATGLKTGYTANAKYCLSATAERDGMELIAVVMGCPTSAERTAACKSMLDYGFANYAVVSPTLNETPEVAVTLGNSASVPLKLADSASLVVDKGKKSSVETVITTVQSVDAPVSEGQALGTLELREGEETLLSVPLVAAQSVERLTWGKLFVRVLRRACMAAIGWEVTH